MNLITMAHLGEAQGVIDLLGLERSAENLYESKDYILILTGEGPFEAAVATAAVIQRYEILHAYNLGIAGSLNPKMEIGQMFQVRSLYLVIDGKPQFKTFQCSDTGHDCLTSFERILTPEKAKTLVGLGEIVDREAWGVAFACRQNNIPFSCFKVISDQAGSIEACELIKTKAKYFAELISNNAKNILKFNNEIILEGFHFTFSTKIQFEQKLQMLCKRDDKASDEVISKLDLDILRELKILPKDRTRLLLQKMDQQLDPLKEKVDLRLSHWKNPWNAKGITIQTDSTFEDPSVTLSFKVSTDEELKQKVELLSHFSLRPYQEIREGHVE
jgi:hypothetical protein